MSPVETVVPWSGMDIDSSRLVALIKIQLRNWFLKYALSPVQKAKQQELVLILNSTTCIILCICYRLLVPVRPYWQRPRVALGRPASAIQWSNPSLGKPAM